MTHQPQVPPSSHKPGMNRHDRSGVRHHSIVSCPHQPPPSGALRRHKKTTTAGIHSTQQAAIAALPSNHTTLPQADMYSRTYCGDCILRHCQATPQLQHVQNFCAERSCGTDTSLQLPHFSKHHPSHFSCHGIDSAPSHNSHILTHHHNACPSSTPLSSFAPSTLDKPYSQHNKPYPQHNPHSTLNKNPSKKRYCFSTSSKSVSRQMWSLPRFLLGNPLFNFMPSGGCSTATGRSS